jgi:glycolate oxidase iron-sulfur subunit
VVVESAESGTGQGAAPLGAMLPEGTRFIGVEDLDAASGPVPEGGPEPGPESARRSAWIGPDFPADADLNACVACGLCLPHCPTYRLTGEESASPRGRIAAMRAVNDGIAEVDDTFASFMDLCLSCRACEDVCPSHVPFGRMMERARTQIEPRRPRRERLARRLGLDVVLPRPWLINLLTAALPLARPFMPRRLRALLPSTRPPRRRDTLPEVTELAPGVAERGTVAMLAGCVQDRWFRSVNRATIRVLARNGWRVVVPRNQVCCGALAAHYGHLGTARSLASANARAFRSADAIVVNAAGCGAHMKEYGELLPGDGAAAATSGRVRDLMEFLDEVGIEDPPHGAGVARAAYHDACHALRAQGIRAQPRAVLGRVPGLELVDLPGGDRCCGAAGLYNILEPEMSDELQRLKGDAIRRTGAPVVATANPGCAMQLAAGLLGRSPRIEVVHPAELLDRAYAPPSARTSPAGQPSTTA